MAIHSKKSCQEANVGPTYDALHNARAMKYLQRRGKNEWTLRSSR